MSDSLFYGPDIAAIHADSFTDIARAAADAADQLLEPGSRVLDVGCGEGTTAGALAAAGHDVTGIDRSAAMIELARTRHPAVQFHVADDARLPDLHRLDAVLAIGEVLAYLDDRPANPLHLRLSALLALLKPGGLLLFDLPVPGRARGHDQRTWTTGEDWAVLASGTESGGELERQVITFRRTDEGDYRRRDERHRLQLFPQAAVLDALHLAGARSPQALEGYGRLALPGGLIAYSARRPNGATFPHLSGNEPASLSLLRDSRTSEAPQPRGFNA